MGGVPLLQHLRTALRVIPRPSAESDPAQGATAAGAVIHAQLSADKLLSFICLLPAAGGGQELALHPGGDSRRVLLAGEKEQGAEAAPQQAVHWNAHHFWRRPLHLLRDRSCGPMQNK